MHEYGHGGGGCSVTGGFVYRGSRVRSRSRPLLLRRLLHRRVWSFKLRAGCRVGFSLARGLTVAGGLTSFGEGPGRELFLVSQNGRGLPPHRNL